MTVCEGPGSALELRRRQSSTPNMTVSEKCYGDFMMVMDDKMMM